MKINGIQMLDGSVVENLTIASGSSFPPAIAAGELFYKTGASPGLYAYNGSSWIIQGGSSGGGGGASSLPGEVKLVAFSSGAPGNWLICDGQGISATRWPELFAAIGTTYGGNSTTFNIPDLRNRVPMQVGTGTLGVAVALGGKGGTSTNNLSFVITSAQMPTHKHTAVGTMLASNDLGQTSEPIANGWLGINTTTANAQPNLYTSETIDGISRLADGTVVVDIENAGESTPVDLAIPAVLPAYVGMNYIIYAGTEVV